ncbi:Cytochrome P450 71D8 [Linum grandiflorum]
MHKASDSILDRVIEEHKSKRTRGNKDDELENEDLVDVLLNLQENQNLGVSITKEVIKAVILELFLGGIETSSTTIEWIMSEMITYDRVLQKAQEEDMIISEGLRLHPPLPLLVPRENDNKAELNGYDIPMKTQVIVNVWAINRDARYWPDPHKFYPERFNDCSTDYKGNYHQFIPFGAGRRMCPGVSFGISIVKLTLANLLFHFDWEFSNETKQENLDMSEVFGVSLRKKYALRLIPIPYKA